MPPPPNLLGYPDMDPPSYAPVVKQNKTSVADDNDQHTFGNLRYVPVYTYAKPYQVIPSHDYEYPTSSLVGAKIFRKIKIFYSLMRTRRCAYQGVRNVIFSENFTHVLNK